MCKKKKKPKIRGNSSNISRKFKDTRTRKTIRHKVKGIGFVVTRNKFVSSKPFSLFLRQSKESCALIINSVRYIIRDRSVASVIDPRRVRSNHCEHDVRSIGGRAAVKGGASHLAGNVHTQWSLSRGFRSVRRTVARRPAKATGRAGWPPAGHRAPARRGRTTRRRTHADTRGHLDRARRRSPETARLTSYRTRHHITSYVFMCILLAHTHTRARAHIFLLYSRILTAACVLSPPRSVSAAAAARHVLSMDAHIHTHDSLSSTALTYVRVERGAAAAYVRYMYSFSCKNTRSSRTHHVLLCMIYYTYAIHSHCRPLAANFAPIHRTL